ncbi:hypothetical protein RhiirA4_484885 [Rhizophagus irregularis]|uniref:Restriction endonuclease domain-containing protein n=1 Tax=Rhizophagus irregularis TaxID=588596 RepID=A0A2I1HPF8_9GLOM|nr:hypothetical protein RhiirA4_484885 [Rhizophagus irregularis]
MPISNIEENFKLARNALLDFDKKDIIRENSKEEVTAEETGPREIVVFYDVTLEKYHQKFLQEHRRFSVYVRLVKGKVIAYEIPSPPHASLVADLIPILAGWTNRLKIYAELDMIVGNENDTVNCADIVIEPRHVPAPGTGYVPRPRMIIEVGKTETIESLNSLAGEYFSNSVQSSLVQVYLSIKMFSRRTNDTVAMVATLYLRNNQVPNLALNQPNPPPNTPPTVPMTNTIPNLVISFGTAPLHQVSRTFINNIGVRNDRIIGYLQNDDPACVAPGMANYQINIPSHLLFQGYPGGVPHEIPNNFTLDLWNVQQYIFDKLIYDGFELKLNSLRINVF